MSPYARSDLGQLVSGPKGRRRCGGGGWSPPGGALAPWDVDYAIQQSVQEAQAGVAWSDLSDYFTLECLLEGVGRLLGRVFGLGVTVERVAQQGTVTGAVTAAGAAVQRVHVAVCL